MLNIFEKKIADSLSSATLKSDNGIVLAVSGGADSTALMKVFYALKQERVFSGDILCVHVNHCLRGEESDEDERFVVELAAHMGFDVVTQRVDVMAYSKENAISIETAAREMRIAALAKVAQKSGYKQIATAHHADDNAETIVQRLSRGTGLRGLCGIWPAKEFASGVEFVRPQLFVGRQEIVNYLKDSHISWREDVTNKDCCFRRNFIRHKLLPELEKNSSANIVEKLNKLSFACRSLMEKVSKEAETFCSENMRTEAGKISLATDGFMQLNREVAVEIIRRALEAIGCREGQMSSEHYQRIINLAQQAESGRKVELSKGFVVVYEYASLTFFKSKDGKLKDDILKAGIELAVPGKITVNNYVIEAEIVDRASVDLKKFVADKNEFVELFDIDKVSLPLRVGFRKEGDKFLPLGFLKEKKVGKFLTAQKVESNIRRSILIVRDSEKIIWVWPVRTSELCKVTDSSSKLLRLEIKRSIP